MKQTNKDKGDLLEDAVHVIESFIFSVLPGLREAKISFERNKIVTLKGARNEIDLLARAEFGKSLDVIFIFECKNWEKKVGKNEVIIFSEKIEELKAHKGFIMAKAFTKDAKERAKYDGRIELVHVSNEISLDTFPIEYYSPSIFNIKLFLQGDIPSRNFEMDEIFKLEGFDLQLNDLVNRLSIEIQNEIYATEPNLMLREHTFEKEKIFPFDQDRLLFQDKVVKEIKASFEFEIKRISPVVKSQYDVEKRGRYCTIEFNDPSNGIIMSTSFSQLK